MAKVINVKEVIGHERAITYDDGDKVRDRICQLLDANEKFYVSFEGIEFLVCPFLSSAIGRLFDGRYTREKLKSSIRFKFTDEDDHILLKAAVDDAICYYKNPKRYRWARKMAGEGY